MSTEKSQLEKTNIGLASIHNEGEDISPQQLSMPAVPIQRVASGKTNTEELQSEKDQHSMNGVESRVLASYSSVPPDDDGSNGQKNGNTLQGKFQSPNPLQFKIPKSTLKSFSAPTLQLKTNTIQKQSEEEEPVQGKFNTIQKQSEEEEPVQGRFNTIQKQGEEEEPVQAKSTNPNGLPAPVQTQMENALGSDFSNVNIHTNSKSATDVGALAYTQGNDVHFAPGQYNPESSSGQELIGHELTHVVQQREGRVQPTTQAAGLPVNDDKGLEAEADAGGQKAVQMKGGQLKVKKSMMEQNLSGLIQKQSAPISPALTPSPISPQTRHLQGPITEDEQRRRDTFLAQNIYGPIDAVSTTGTGRMSSTYQTNIRRLLVTIQAKVVYHSGLSIGNNGTVTVISTGHADKDAILQNAAQAANNLHRSQRALFVRRFIWTPQEIRTGRQRLSQTLRQVENNWSNKHSFYINKVGWDDITSSVQVRINETEGTASNVAGDQLNIINVKTPSNIDLGAAVYSNNSTSQFNDLVIDDDYSRGSNSSNLLRQSVYFENNSSDLTADAKNTLDTFALTYGDDKTANNSVDNKVLNNITLEGHTSSVGTRDRNVTLGQERINKVRDYLQSKGLHRLNERVVENNQADTNSGIGSRNRRVDLIVGTGQNQHTLTHEFGHVMGLKDEYAVDPGGGISGTGNATGTAIGHDGLSQSIGAGNATSENNDGIMSLGNEIRGQHYSTFGEALKNVTNINEWTLQ